MNDWFMYVWVGIVIGLVLAFSAILVAFWISGRINR